VTKLAAKKIALKSAEAIEVAARLPKGATDIHHRRGKNGIELSYCDPGGFVMTMTIPTGIPKKLRVVWQL